MPDPNALRVLLVSRNMPPMVGGMERLNWHIADELRSRAELRVVAPIDSARLAPRGITYIETRGAPLPVFLMLATIAATRTARVFRPDIVLAGSGLMAPVAEVAARASGAAAIAYVHGLDLAVRNVAYRAAWIPSIRRMRRVIANSRFTAALCKASGVAPERIGIVNPGVSAALSLTPSNSGTFEFRQRYSLGDGPLLLSVGRLTARKGLREFVAGVLPMIAAAHPDLRFVVIGGEPVDALNSAGHSQAELTSVAKDSGVERHVVFLGHLDDEEVRQAWIASAAHVFPIRELPGDPEGFGMVAVEAAAHGVPTVAYAVGGVPDAVFDGVSGCLVGPEDEVGFAAAVLKALRGEFSGASMREWAQRFEWPRFGDAITSELLLARG